MVKLRYHQYRSYFVLASLLSIAFSLILGTATVAATAAGAGTFSNKEPGLNPNQASAFTLQGIQGVECATPLIVNNTGDDESSCGTLRFALAYLAANPAVPDKQITFSLAPGLRIALTGGLTIPAGGVIQGSCGADGPEIFLDGTGVTADGLTLSGDNSLEGVAVGGFSGRQLVAASGSTSNTLKCAKIMTGPLDLVTTQGTPQSATVGTAFSQGLQLVVKRWYGEPLQGVNVTFTVNGNGGGASGSFGGASPTTATVTTDSTGLAVAPTLEANTRSGGFTVTAAVSGFSNQAVYNLTNLPGAPASITVNSGDNQTATVGTIFGTSFKTLVTDTYNNPVGGVAVTYTAPSPGAGATGTFPGGSAATVTTDQNGIATAPSFTASHTAGSYSVNAGVNGVNPSASFSLTNQAGPPSSLAVVAGSGQQAGVATTFSSQLKARVRDVYGNNLSGVSVLFTAPASGPSGTFSGSGTGSSVYASTDSNGIATAPNFTANTLAGSYTVSASVSGIASTAGFSLSNLPGAPASIAVVSGSGQSANVGSAFASPLKAVVRDGYGNALSGVGVTFGAPASGASATFSGAGSSASATTNVSGVATSPTLTANATAGSYTAYATVAGLGSSAGFALTNVSNVTTYEAWVSDPHPGKYSAETVYGKLIVNGLPAQGASMDTTWHYRTTTSYCSGTVGSDGVGSCTKNTGNVTIGYTVVIDVVFTYNGRTYSTSTSFTP